jgi:amidase
MLHISIPTAPSKMSSEDLSKLNYPVPREGPEVPYKNETQVIPVFRGTPLAIGATL